MYKTVYICDEYFEVTIHKIKLCFED